MSRKSDRPAHRKQDDHPPKDEPTGVNRRDFLKTSALGAGVAALPAAGCARLAATEVPRPDSGDPQRACLTPQTPDYTTQSDTWVTPWEWVQKDWPGQQLHLNVVEHAAPVALFGNIGKAEDANVGQLLFSWNGISPGPTMRVGGDDTLFVQVRNMLGPNDGVLLVPNGKVPPLPDSPSPPDQTPPNPFLAKDEAGRYLYVTETPDYCRPIHTNHKHQIRTTNLHFHGSHVRPYLNPDGTRSDDIFLRIIPQEDFALREATDNHETPPTQDEDCWPLKSSEVLAEADYEYRLGIPGGARETHPPGTHWYHPHAHGSTFTQVASGMAGLIIVEGDVDDYLKEQLDPTGEGITYAERPIVIQRIVGPTAVDIEEGFEKDGARKTKSSTAFPAVNGQSISTVENYIVVKPQSVERWRVLNAGVDGQGYIEFTVREGATIDGAQYDNIYHLASDGITLVNAAGEYHTRRVTKPLMMAPANRADFLFQAPQLTPAELSTGYKLLSIWVTQPESASDSPPTVTPLRIATIIVRGDPASPPGGVDLADLRFPDLPRYLLPVTDDDITVKPGDPDYGVRSGMSKTQNDGMLRGRRVIYSGWGGGLPAGTTNRLNQLIAYNKSPQEETGSQLLGGVHGPESMLVDCRKFNDDPDDLMDIGHRMLQGTAEEWTVSNLSLTLFNDVNGGGPEQSGDPADIPTSYDSRPENLANEPYPSVSQKANDVASRAVDHPFHIHINPCWVTGIYDWEGKPLGWNYERIEDEDEFYPRWHDVIRLPRNGGWVTFRSRYWDFAGEFVNHCHILQHEDNGMMQGIAIVVQPDQADYIPFTKGQTFPKPTWHQCYTLDWGVANDADRDVCDGVRDELRKPSSG